MFQVQHSGGFTQDRSWNMPSLFTPCASWVNCSSTKREESFSPSKWRSTKVQLCNIPWTFHVRSIRSTGIRSNYFDWLSDFEYFLFFLFVELTWKKAVLSSFIFHWTLPSSPSLWLRLDVQQMVTLTAQAAIDILTTRNQIMHVVFYGSGRFQVIWWL